MLRHRRRMRFRWCRQLRPIRESPWPALWRDRRCRSRRVRRGTGGQSPIVTREHTRSAYGGEIGVAAAAGDRRRKIHPRHSPE